MSKAPHPFVAAKSEKELLAVKRDVHDKLWGDVRAQIEAAMAKGETQLSRVLRMVESDWRRLSEEAADGTAFGEKISIPRSALIRGRQAFRMQTLLDACRPDTALVVELGCGWGLNLADLHLSGGPRDAAYVGLDLSSEGIACLRMLARLEGAPKRLTGGPFNFLQPDYSMLPRAGGHALVFSFHAIEQIKTIPEAAITGLFGIADRVTGVHHEPVGWQIREARGLPPADCGATRESSARYGYNENLWSVLSGLERTGQIRAVKAVPDIFGHKRKNASSLIVWERA